MALVPTLLSSSSLCAPSQRLSSLGFPALFFYPLSYVSLLVSLHVFIALCLPFVPFVPCLPLSYLFICLPVVSLCSSVNLPLSMHRMSLPSDISSCISNPYFFFWSFILRLSPYVYPPLSFPYCLPPAISSPLFLSFSPSFLSLLCLPLSHPMFLPSVYTLLLSSVSPTFSTPVFPPFVESIVSCFVSSPCLFPTVPLPMSVSSVFTLSLSSVSLSHCLSSLTPLYYRTVSPPSLPLHFMLYLIRNSDYCSNYNYRDYRWYEIVQDSCEIAIIYAKKVAIIVIIVSDR